MGSSIRASHLARDELIPQNTAPLGPIARRRPSPTPSLFTRPPRTRSPGRPPPRRTVAVPPARGRRRPARRAAAAERNFPGPTAPAPLPRAPRRLCSPAAPPSSSHRRSLDELPARACTRRRSRCCLDEPPLLPTDASARPSRSTAHMPPAARVPDPPRRVRLDPIAPTAACACPADRPRLLLDTGLCRRARPRRRVLRRLDGEPLDRKSVV